ncbi:hypothetical protein BGW80DRAFT_1363370 [Lactifluus volemus]|nr:hypothetical protein BGW80DRAFT_1363370 [Lactifluus volemus]
MATPTYPPHFDSNLTLPSLLPIISTFPVPMPLRNQRHRIQATPFTPRMGLPGPKNIPPPRADCGLAMRRAPRSVARLG